MAVTYLKTSDVQKKIDRIKQMGGNARFKLVGGSQLDGQYWDLYIDRINPKTNRPQKNFKILSYVGLNDVSSELDKLIATTRDPSLQSHRWYRTTNRLLLKNRKKKTRRKVIRRKRRVVRRNPVIEAYDIRYDRSEAGRKRLPKRLKFQVDKGFNPDDRLADAVSDHTGVLVSSLKYRELRGNPYLSRDVNYDMGYAGTVVIPKGTRVDRATNLPTTDKGRERYWARGWRGMKEREKSWARNYGYLIESEDVVSKRPLRGNPMRSSFDKPTFGPGQAEYRRVDTTTMAGIKEAERLQRAGWYTAQTTPFSTTYYRRKIRKNPPMYAHGMMSHRTHGLSLKQMMKLYRLVSSGNPKAVMFARRTLGIPMSESLSQVKAVVYHHILDLKGKI
jgi:hypothetical protein